MHKVRDGSRTLQFDGVLLAKSSSRRGDSNRWIEFELYRTTSGSYVLSRVGVSLVFHGGNCPLVSKYKLREAYPGDLRRVAVPCEECYPDRDLPIVFPEKDRTWAQVSEDPGAVLEALYKYDYGGARYLTHVAKRLLEDASDQDQGIDSVYRVEIVP